MRTFTFGELWGHFLCETPGCKNDASTVILTDEENKSLPAQSGPVAATFIFQKRLGKAACNECLKTVLG